MTTNIEKKEMFFEDENNAKVMDIFLRVASNAQMKDGVLDTRLSLSKGIVEYITTEPAIWDEKCQFNIKYIGNKFIQLLRGFNQEERTKINNIYVLSYRFLCEYDFFVGAGKRLNIELNIIKDRIENDHAEMDADIRSQINYASYVMPINILKELLQDLNIDAFKSFEQKKIEADTFKKEWDVEIQTKRTNLEDLKKSWDMEIQTKRTNVEDIKKSWDAEIQAKTADVDNLKKNWDTEIQAKTADVENFKKDWNAEIQSKTVEVDALKKSLEKYKDGFNFVGLYQGFDDLATEKQKERDSILKWLRRLSGLIVVPIIVQMFFVYRHIDDISSVGYGLALLTLSTFSLVAIAIYYFRVLLFNYKSVKSQLLQIDLRKTLCRFIQDYAKLANKMKKEDVNSLEKFESIIFSGIVAEDRSMPSTFDGGEQFGKWIGRFIKSEDNRG